jgi:ADP-dependent NAD(P)H-hydrate dehydratase / NAD(P)H-hydrate epimerase
MKLVTVPQMRLIEQEADGSGLSYDQMMENAGHNLALDVLKLAYIQDDEEAVQVLGLVGPGNNGGDTLVALAHLAEKGWKARAYLVQRKASADQLVKRLEDADGEIFSVEKDKDFTQLQTFLETADVVLDGILGTGAKLPLKENVSSVLASVKNVLEGLEWPPYTVAVDCPSGIDCDSGEAADETITVDATVTMAAVKQGLLKLPAYDRVGELRVIGIGDLDGYKTWQAVNSEVADEKMVESLLPKRPSDAYKGTFGTVLIAAGSVNYTGAAVMAGKAAYRVGAGLVTMAVPAPVHMALAGQFIEATWVLLPSEMGVIASSAAHVLAENLKKATVLLIGPGMGLEETTKEFIGNLLSIGLEKPGRAHIGFVRNQEVKTDQKPITLPALVIDADGLKLLAKYPDWPKLLTAEAILTPHPGEMSVLTGLPVEEIQKDRLNIAQKYAREWGHVVVLKGAFTVVAAPDGRTTTIPVATAALARAGTGDVLAGLIAGLRGQGLAAYDAGRVGAWLHAQAGLAAAEVIGSMTAVMAGDVLEAIPDVMAQFG